MFILQTAGLRYGLLPKMLRIQTGHQYLFYLCYDTYGHPLKTAPKPKLTQSGDGEGNGESSTGKTSEGSDANTSGNDDIVMASNDDAVKAADDDNADVTKKTGTFESGQEHWMGEDRVSLILYKHFLLFFHVFVSEI